MNLYKKLSLKFKYFLGSLFYLSYSDAGDGYAQWRVDRFRMVRDENGLELTWEQQGDYAFPYKAVQVHLHGFKLQQAWVDGTEVSCQGNYLECAQFGQAYFKGEFAHAG